MTRRVLLLDDNDAARLTLAALLEAEAFEVVEVSCLRDARTSLATAPAFNLALLDRHLGDGHGGDLIPLVRAQLPDCKIIIVSGSGSRSRSGDGAAERADDYFDKGEDPDELLQKIQELLGSCSVPAIAEHEGDDQRGLAAASRDE